MFAMNRIHALVATFFLLVMAHAIFGVPTRLRPIRRGNGRGGCLSRTYDSIQNRCAATCLYARSLSFRERVARQRRVRAARPTIRQIDEIVGRVCPHPALRATFSRREKDTPPRFLLFRAASPTAFTI
jgi:hypothetical protein